MLCVTWDACFPPVWEVGRTAFAYLQSTGLPCRWGDRHALCVNLLKSLKMCKPVCEAFSITEKEQGEQNWWVPDITLRCAHVAAKEYHHHVFQTVG